ncbi:hypothetical protein NMG60_11034553 [Bertholletia excelsa]
MMRGLSASPPTSSATVYTLFSPSSHTRHSSLHFSAVIPRLSNEHYGLSSSDLKPGHIRFGGVLPNTALRCNSSTRPGGPGPGESDSRSVLDAFFLGKALAEALNERIESAVGEFLSAIGRLQAEQRKQVQDFQEDVFERAKKAKEKAAREALEARGLIPTSSPADVSTSARNGPSGTDVTTQASSPSSNSGTASIDTDLEPNDKDSLLGVSTED